MIITTSWKTLSRSLWRWEHFTPEEMACHGDGSLQIDEGLMDALEHLRVDCGFPFVVSSGYRSPEYNKTVSHTGDDGPHTKGKAVDLIAGGERVYKIVAAAPRFGFTGIGLSQRGDYTKRFIHLDILPQADGQPRPTVWTY